MKSIAEKSFQITGLFEAELLVRLMLWRWKHPHADDAEFANGLVEDASNALRVAINGQKLIENIPPTDFNFVAAVWYAEHCALEIAEDDPQTIEARKDWLAAVRRTLPSCFCDPSDLDQP